MKSVVGPREAGSAWPPCSGLSSAAEGGPVGACAAICEERAGEVGRRDMVSAVLLSPDGEEQQLWWLLQTPGCGTPALRGCRSAAPPLGRVCAERWAPQRGSALHAVTSSLTAVVWVLNLEAAC